MTPIFRQPGSVGRLVSLTHDPFELVVSPQFGARIVSFSTAKRNILRPASPAALEKPLVCEFAGFPLMPYSGPLFGSGFSFAGSSHELGRTVREEPTATHGEAWISSFGIVEQGDAKLTLEMEHRPQTGTYPFAYRARVGFTLDDYGLAINLTLTSLHHAPIPGGIGFHPYFPRPPGTRLRFAAIGVWPADAPEAVNKGCGSMIDGLDFNNGQDVSLMVVDRLYEGWTGVAELTAEDGFRTLISADSTLDKLQLYSPSGYPYVCVEPVSNANDGFNRMTAGVASHGVRLLEPNRSLEGNMRISVDHQGHSTMRSGA